MNSVDEVDEVNDAENETEPTKNISELVQVYLTIRDAREKLASQWKAQDAEFSEDLARIERAMMVTFNNTDAKSIRTDHGTVVRRLNERFTIADGDIFRKFVMENNAPELFEGRIHQGNFKEYVAEHQGEGMPPGVNVMREFVIVVRKAS